MEEHRMLSCGCCRHVLWAVVCVVFAADLRALAAPLPEGFVLRSSDSSWKVTIEPVPDGTGSIASAVVATFPGNTVSRPGEFVTVTVSLAIPQNGVADLSFRFSDSFVGRTAGFHFAEVLLGETILFERDVAGGAVDPQFVRLDLRKTLPQGGRATLAFRFVDRRAVSNFPVVVRFIDPVLKTADGAKRLLPPTRITSPEPLPPDLPLPSLLPGGENWTRTARIVQPWGPTQWDAIARAEELAPRLAKHFGFNTIIILPPEAHNAITTEKQHVSESQFGAARRAYRAAGFRVILYTSIMHCGHAPVWQGGSLTKTHPEWSQRGPQGEPVTIYGAEWLCPSTGALAYTIEYTAGIVRRWGADAVMLDNNQFFSTPSGLTCHCAGCQSGFRRYIKARFGEAVFGKPSDEVKIPTRPGPLYNLWLLWRNRVWADAIEQFRIELRKDNPHIVVLANTQYLRSSPDLATDLQYEHEDAVLSESRGMSLDGIVDKLLLGRALAKDRPLWNYLGTFQEGDFGRLVSAELVSMNVSTSLACLARPWVVYYGFFENPEANKESLLRMRTTLAWHQAHDPQRQGLRPYAPVLSLVSLGSRNCRAARLIPIHVGALRKMGVCTWMIEESALSGSGLERCRVLLIEDAPCLSQAGVAAIVAFVRAGGVVIASAGTGLYDQIGRARPRSALWTELGLSHSPLRPVQCGKGTALAMTLPARWKDLAEWLRFAQFTVEPETQAAVLPYLDPQGQFVVYVCAAGPLPADIRVQVPGRAPGKAIICSPDQPEPRIVDLAQ